MLKKLSEDTAYEATMTLLYGEPGSGKTFWASGVSDRSIFLTDLNGKVTLKSKLFKETVGTDPFVDVLTPDDSPVNANAFDTMRNKIDGYFAPDMINEWDYLIIDDANFARLAARNKGVQLNGLSGRSKTSVNAQSGKFKDIILMTQADFGTEMGLVEAFLRELCDACRSAGKNLIVCAHSRLYMKEGSNTVIAIKPLFTGVSTPDVMPGIFDNVWYLRSIGTGGNVKREIVTDNEGPVMAKTRWSGLFKNPERELTAKQAFKRINDWQTSQHKT